MEKKTIGTTIAGILTLIFIVIIGASLSAFKAQPGKVELEEIFIQTSGGLIVQEIGAEPGDPGLTKLKVKSSGVGLKPATGEEDDETTVPHTVNDQIGSEGAYSSFQIVANQAWKIVLKSVDISVGNKYNEFIKITIIEEGKGVKSLHNVGTTLAEGEQSEDPKELTVIVWLHPFAPEGLEGADIKITLSVEPK